MHRELRIAQALTGMPALEPAFLIAKIGDTELFWDGESWNKTRLKSKLYSSIKEALDDRSVPPAITEVQSL